MPWASSKDLKAEELFDTQDHISQKALDDGIAELVPGGSILTVVRGTQALNSKAVQQGLKNILLDHARLWETLKNRAA
ncbi:MAG: hypothetical protein WEB60_13805 [Terrimicrobiaceae bacterium]